MPRKKLEDNRILRYVAGLLYFYGTIDFEGLFRVVKNNLPISLNRKTFRGVLDKEMADECGSYVFDYDDGLYYHIDVEDATWVLEEQGKRADIIYRPVSEKETQLVMNEQYPGLWHADVKKMVHFFRDWFRCSEREAHWKIYEFSRVS